MKLINPDPDNRMFDLAVRYVNDTDRNLFITGKAGTGKTTFLKYIKNNCPKQMVVVAPTGVAAINAGGVTAHSFFQLPLAPFIPDSNRYVNGMEVYNRHSLTGKLKINSDKRRVIEQLEVLVLDEISMMAADTLDAIDAVLRHVRHRHSEPFGGVQLVLIGDLYQLQPVVTDNEWDILSKFYPSPFFFDSVAFKQRDSLMIEFDKIYRQSDPEFIRLLNNVRNNQMATLDFEKLNSLYRSHITNTDGYITLTTHNVRAETINNFELNKLTTPLHVFSAEVKGEFNDRTYPVERELKLRIGAQVMFVRNDSSGAKKYFNGKIGKLTGITNECLYVQCENEDEIAVIKETWENIKYTFDDTTHQLKEEEIGFFTQYPLRTAWAITIHKSQGLTFDKVIIDAGEAFVSGQVYVALSRCTSLDGIILKSIIRPHVITTDERIEKGFDQTDEHELRGLLSIASVEYNSRALSSVFDSTLLQIRIAELLKYVNTNTQQLHADSIHWAHNLHTRFANQQTQLSNLQIDVTRAFGLENDDDRFRSVTQESVRSFIDIIMPLLTELAACRIRTSSRLHAKEINKIVKELYEHIDWMLHLARAITNGWSVQAWQRAKHSYRKPPFTYNSYVAKNPNPPKEFKHPVLYSRLKKLRDEICDTNRLPVYLVANAQTLDLLVKHLPLTKDQLLQIPGFGPSKVERFGNRFISLLQDYVDSNNINITEFDAPEKKSRKSDIYHKNTSSEVTWLMYAAGHSIEEIAKQRGFAVSTIEGHLLPYIMTGDVAITNFLHEDHVNVIQTILAENRGKSLTEVRALLNDQYTFSEIRFVIAAMEGKLSSHIHH